jgi:hypothetical protein
MGLDEIISWVSQSPTEKNRRQRQSEFRNSFKATYHQHKALDHLQLEQPLLMFIFNVYLSLISLNRIERWNLLELNK